MHRDAFRLRYFWADFNDIFEKLRIRCQISTFAGSPLSIVAIRVDARQLPWPSNITGGYSSGRLRTLQHSSGLSMMREKLAVERTVAMKPVASSLIKVLLR